MSRPLGLRRRNGRLRNGRSDETATARETRGPAPSPRLQTTSRRVSEPDGGQSEGKRSEGGGSNRVHIQAAQQRLLGLGGLFYPLRNGRLPGDARRPKLGVAALTRASGQHARREAGAEARRSHEGRGQAPAVALAPQTPREICGDDGCGRRARRARLMLQRRVLPPTPHWTLYWPRRDQGL